MLNVYLSKCEVLILLKQEMVQKVKIKKESFGYTQSLFHIFFTNKLK